MAANKTNFRAVQNMIKKIQITYAVDYIAAIIVVLIQIEVGGLMGKFIIDIFDTRHIIPIIVMLLSVITYSLYFGNSKLAFIVGFLLPVPWLVESVTYRFFITGFPQYVMAWVRFGVIFGLIGTVLSVFKRNASIATRISMHLALVISILGIPPVFSSLGLDYLPFWYVFNSIIFPVLILSYFILHDAKKSFVFTFSILIITFLIIKDLLFWFVFNSAVITELLLSHLILRDVKKAFIFTFSAIVITFLVILFTPLYSILEYRTPPFGLPLFGIIIAIILAAILKAYTYYQAHKIRG